MPLLHSMNQVK